MHASHDDVAKVENWDREKEMMQPQQPHSSNTDETSEGDVMREEGEEGNLF